MAAPDPEQSGPDKARAQLKLGQDRLRSGEDMLRRIRGAMEIAKPVDLEILRRREAQLNRLLPNLRNKVGTLATRLQDPAPRRRRFDERLSDAIRDSAEQGLAGYGVRRFADATNLGMPSDAELKQRGITREQAEKIHDEAIRVNSRNRRAEYARMWEEEGDHGVADYAAEVLGNIIGGADPTYLIGGPAGKGLMRVGQRILTQAGVNAGVDAGTQALEIHEGTRDNYDLGRTVLNAAGGTVFASAGELARMALRALRARRAAKQGRVASRSVGEQNTPNVPVAEDGWVDVPSPERRAEPNRRSTAEDEVFQDFAQNRAIGDYAAAKNLDHIEVGRHYHYGNDPELRAEIDANADKIAAEMTPRQGERRGDLIEENPSSPVAPPDEELTPASRLPVADKIDPEAEYRTESVQEDGTGGGEPPRQPPEPPNDKPPPGDNPPPDRGGGDGEPPKDDAVARLTAALNTAGRLNREQRAMYREARSEKLARVRGVRDATSGEAGFHAELGQLKGELPKVDFEGVRERFSQEDIDGLFDTIKEHPSLRFSVYDPINARKGLSKLLHGQLPTRSEIDLLSKVFPSDFIKATLRHRRLTAKVLDATGNALNLPRSLMSSMDLSAPFRQGLFLVGRKEFWKAFPAMFKEFGTAFMHNDGVPVSERGANWQSSGSAVLDEIKGRATYPLMEEAGLSITSTGHDISAREEAFASQWAEKIPIAGRLVRASNAAYTGFLNKLRADTFDTLLRLSRDADVDFRRNPKALTDIASFVNNATGRGNLGKLSQAGPILNGLLFSPRLMASRITLLNPAYYVQLSPVVRKEAVKSLLATGAILTTILGLAAAAGLDVETDPRSSDFAKIKSGDTRFDILGGFGQYLTLAARLSTNSTKKLSGEVKDLGKGYKADTRLDVAERFLASKYSPIFSYITDYLRGKNVVGEPFDPASDAAERFVPMFAQDVYDEVQERGAEGLLTAAPSAFGVGVQTFDTPTGYDVYGRNFHDLPSTETDPAIQEVTRLSTDLDTPLINNPSRVQKVGGEKRSLTQEEFAAYQQLSGNYVLETIREEMSSPDWAGMDDEDKRDEIKSIVKDSRTNAREDLFGSAEDQEDEAAAAGWTPETPDSTTSSDSDKGWIDGPPTLEEALRANPFIAGFTAGRLESGRRTPEGNAAVGGVRNSRHKDGDSADFIPAQGQSMAALRIQAKKYFGPDAYVKNEGDHIHVSKRGLNAPYFGKKGVQ